MSNMARKRNLINEIISRRSRLQRRTKRWIQVNKRLKNITDSYWIIKGSGVDQNTKKEMYRYIPIACVACIEGWFRIAVADLVNCGSPFRENIKSYKDVPFNFDFVLALQNKSLTLGDFVAHFIRIRQLDDIIKNLSLIIGHDFVDLFEKVRVQPHHKHTLAGYFKTSRIFDGVRKGFELRHIFCHELATSINYYVQTIEDCAYWTVLFLIGAEGVIEDILKHKK